jgi:hypothetical protein
VPEEDDEQEAEDDAPTPRGRPPLPVAEREKRTARRKLWKKGILDWKLEERPWCRELYDWIRGNWGCAGYLATMMHRRAGKTSVAWLIALEECLRKRDTSVAIICSTMQQMRDISKEVLKPLLIDCPRSLRPRHIKNDFAWVFDHNGSRISVLPADKTNWKNARGRKNDFVIFSEAAFIPSIKPILGAILPTLRDVTDKWSGTLLLESTPPDEPDTAFEELWGKAEADGRTFLLPLSENKWAGPGFRESAAIDSGGVDTVVYQREYELQFVYESETTALPEFTMKTAFEEHNYPTEPPQGSPPGTPPTLGPTLPPIVREKPRPTGVDLYASLDPGGRHLTGALWGFYDFSDDAIVIEDELTLKNMTTDVLAEKLRAKERILWGDAPSEKVTRYADNNNVILLHDLNTIHKLRFNATDKDNKDAQINQVRLMLKSGRLVIHPRCVVLIKTLRIAKRAKEARKGFVEAKEIGHADLLDALIYLVRNVRRNAMPAQAPTPRPMAEQGVRPQTRSRRSDTGLAQAMGIGRFKR